MPTQFDRGDSWWSSGNNSVLHECGLKSYERITQSLKIQIQRVWLVRKRTNRVGFGFFLTFWILLFSSLQRRTSQFKRRLTDRSSSNWDRMHFSSKSYTLHDFTIPSLLVMISDMLLGWKMINVRISGRKECTKTDSKPFCKSWEEAGGNNRLYRSFSSEILTLFIGEASIHRKYT